MVDYNARFAKPPANQKDLHRPLRAGDDLDDAFAWKEERTLSQALTLQYDKILFILEPTDQAKAAIGKRVSVVDYPDGRLAIRYKGIELVYRTFDKLRQVSQAAIVESKQLGAALAFIRERQTERAAARSRSAPRRPSLQGRLSLPTSRAGARSVKQPVRRRGPTRRSSVGRCAEGSAPARRPTLVTSVNGRDGDISIWSTQPQFSPAERRGGAASPRRGGRRRGRGGCWRRGRLI